MSWAGQIIPNPVPITVAMVTPANQIADRPRYGTPADWNLGVSGNPLDVSKATTPAVGDESPAATGLPAARTMAATMAARVPPMATASDVTKDYGAYANATGRASPIGPRDPYPTSASPTLLMSAVPGIGPAAGGTTVTLAGSGFTGATAVTFGGTAGTGIVVGGDGMLTVNTPAKAAGSYNIVVTSPKGTSAAGAQFTYY